MGIHCTQWHCPPLPALLVFGFFGFWFFDFAKQSGGVVFYLGALQLGDLLPG